MDVICEFCGGNLADATGCVLSEVELNDETYVRLTFGSHLDEEFWAKPCCWWWDPADRCGALIGEPHRRNCSKGSGIRRRPERCYDCRVAWGNLHHPDCGVEVCPRCSRQFASCSCEGDWPLPEGGWMPRGVL